ncbi:MAG: hypothetical protein IJV82_05355, partial [Oscillospiraceae bacterium]|nr:hypothetical protein [Oscillospiraceae bacterium]
GGGGGGGTVSYTGTVVPSIQSFSGNRMEDMEGISQDAYTTYAYYTDFNQDFLNEYVALLEQNYQLCSSISGYAYGFLYTGEDAANLQAFSPLSMGVFLNASEVHVLVVYTGSIYYVFTAPGMTWADTGHRTTQELPDYNTEPTYEPEEPDYEPEEPDYEPDDPVYVPTHRPTPPPTTCDDCGGDGFIDCSVCDGLGYTVDTHYGINSDGTSYTYTTNDVCTSCFGYKGRDCRKCTG